MTTKRIKDLPAATVAALTDRLPIEPTSDVTQKVTGQQLVDLVTGAGYDALDAAATLALADTALIKQSGTPKRATLQQIVDAVNGVGWNALGASGGAALTDEVIGKASGTNKRTTLAQIFTLLYANAASYPATSTLPGFLTNAAQTIGFIGPKTWTATAQSGAETIFIFNVGDDGVAKLEVGNASGVNGLFVPSLKATGSAANISMLNIAVATTDTGTNPVMIFDSRMAAAACTARPTFDFRHFGVSAMQMSAAGGLSIAGGSAPGLTIGASGTKITQTKVYSQSLTPASVAANTTAEQTFTVSGLTTADKVVVNGPAPTAGTGIAGWRVSAADTLAITFANNTGGSLTPASGTYNVVATRS